MPYDLSVVKNEQLAGKQYPHNQTISGGAVEGAENSIAKAWGGVLTTRTDNDTGVLTMNDAGHLIIAAAKIDLYWINPDGSLGTRRGVTAGAVAGTSVPFDLGAGANLPLVNTPITVALVQSFAASIVGNNMKALIAGADIAAAIIVFKTGAVENLALALPAGQNYDWLGIGTNPLAGVTVDTISMSQNDLTAARNVRCAALMN